MQGAWGRCRGTGCPGCHLSTFSSSWTSPVASVPCPCLGGRWPRGKMPGSVLCQGAGGAEPRRVWLCPVARSVDEGTGCAHTHLVVGSGGPRGWQPPGCARAPPRLHASWGHSAGAGFGSIMRAPVGCGLQADLSLSPFLSSGLDPALLGGTKPVLCVPSGAGAS